jgi:lauroyl/myristoyl acyltransferase
MNRNIALVFKDRTPSEVQQICEGVIRGIVGHYQEKIYNGFFDTPDLRQFLISRVTLNGSARVLHEALKEGRGVIIASAHYGALEFLPRYLAVRQYPTVTMVKFKTEQLKEILVRRADEDGLGLIIPGNGTNVMNEASKVIRQNKILVTQCDETDEWRVDRRHTMEFLGQKIHPDRMLSVLHKRTGAVLLFGVMHRTDKEKYELRLHRVPDEGDEPISVRTLKLLEQYIYRNPEQWYEWKKYHKFASSN